MCSRTALGLRARRRSPRPRACPPLGAQQAAQHADGRRLARRRWGRGSRRPRRAATSKLTWSTATKSPKRLTRSSATILIVAARRWSLIGRAVSPVAASATNTSSIDGAIALRSRRSTTPARQRAPRARRRGASASSTTTCTRSPTRMRPGTPSASGDDVAHARAPRGDAIATTRPGHQLPSSAPACRNRASGPGAAARAGCSARPRPDRRSRRRW